MVILMINHSYWAGHFSHLTNNPSNIHQWLVIQDGKYVCIEANQCKQLRATKLKLHEIIKISSRAC